MKKLLMATFVAFFALINVNAQEEGTKGYIKGDVFVTGSASYSSEKFSDEKESIFSFIPSAGFFASENIAIGARIGYGYAKSEFDGEEINKLTQFSAGVFGRYYNKPASQFSLFGQLGASYLSSTIEENDFQEELKVSGFNITLSPGLSYFISEHFALEASLGLLSYQTEKADVDDSESLNTFSTGLNFDDLTIGVVYKF